MISCFHFLKRSLTDISSGFNNFPSNKKERRMPTNRLIVSYTRKRTFDPRREFIPINIAGWADYTNGDE